MAPDRSADLLCISRIRRRAHGLSGLETKPHDGRSRAPVWLHNIRRIRQWIAPHRPVQKPAQSKQQRLFWPPIFWNLSLSTWLPFSREFQLQDGEAARTFRRFLGGRRRRLFWAGVARGARRPAGGRLGSYGRAVRFAYSAAWRRGSEALSSAWPKSSIRSSTSSRPTDNRSRPCAMPSAARCSGLSR